MAAINEGVTFTSCSKDADENQFIAYDGTSATGESSRKTEISKICDPCSGTSITYKFKAAGTYTIELTSKNRIKGNCNNGTFKSDKKAISIIINP